MLFCLDQNKNMFVIPVKDIKESGNTRQISLRTTISNSANTNTFHTSKYLVEM